MWIADRVWPRPEIAARDPQARHSNERIELRRKMAPGQLVRKLRYGGTAGDRNVQKDFAPVAQTFGWAGQDDASPESVWDAYEYLEEHLGATVNAPGYI